MIDTEFVVPERVRPGAAPEGGGGTVRTPSSRRPSPVPYILSLICLVSIACGSGSDETVLAQTEDGWSLTLDELRAEFARVYPDYPFERASLEERQDFFNDVVNDELLVTVAQAQIKELSWLQRRRQLTAQESWLVDAFLVERLGDFKLDAAERARLSESFRRAAKLQRIVPPNKALAESCYADLQRGLSFEDAYRKYAVQSDDARSVFEMGWVTVQRLPQEVVREVFLSGLPTNAYTTPIRTRQGYWIVKLLGFRPANLDPGQQRRVDTVIHFIASQDAMNALRDSLSQAADYRTFEENFPVINRCLSAYWDSLKVQQIKWTEPLIMSWRPPTWLLTPEERNLPIWAFTGQTGTALDFLESLASVSSLLWPAGTTKEMRAHEIKQRIRLLFFREEAVRSGFEQRAEYRAFVERNRRRAYLDDYHDLVLAPNAKVTPEEAVMEYESGKDKYVTAERVSFSYLLFPESKRDQARLFLEKHRTESAADWARAARSLAASDSSIVFDRDTGLLDLTTPPQDLFLEPLLAAARPLESDQISDLVETESGIAVLRCNYRRHSRPQPREAALPMAESTVRMRKIDAQLASILAAAAKERGLVTYPERLAPAATAQSGQTS